MGGEDLSGFYDALYGKELNSTQHIVGYLGIGPEHGGISEQLNDDELVESVLTKMDALFDGQATKNYVRHVVQNWTTEPYVLGAYSFLLTSSSSLKQALRDTVGGGRVLFAGEHTSDKFTALVNGAAYEG